LVWFQNLANQLFLFYSLFYEGFVNRDFTRIKFWGVGR